LEPGDICETRTTRFDLSNQEKPQKTGAATAQFIVYRQGILGLIRCSGSAILRASSFHRRKEMSRLAAIFRPRFVKCAELSLSILKIAKYCKLGLIEIDRIGGIFARETVKSLTRLDQR
jgi:hypothetical protein